MNHKIAIFIRYSWKCDCLEAVIADAKHRVSGAENGYFSPWSRYQEIFGRSVKELPITASVRGSGMIVSLRL